MRAKAGHLISHLMHVAVGKLAVNMLRSPLLNTPTSFMGLKLRGYLSSLRWPPDP